MSLPVPTGTVDFVTINLGLSATLIKSAISLITSYTYFKSALLLLGLVGVL